MSIIASVIPTPTFLSVNYSGNPGMKEKNRFPLPRNDNRHFKKNNIFNLFEYNHIAIHYNTLKITKNIK